MKRRGFGANDGSYRMEHTAPGRGYGSPLFDLTLEGTYPCDVYVTPRHYFDNSPADRESWPVIAQARCAPNTLVTIYRAVPHAVRAEAKAQGGVAIYPGDWVTLSRWYAAQHGRQLDRYGERGVVVSMKVPARTLFTDGNSLNEWGYDP